MFPRLQLGFTFEPSGAYSKSSSSEELSPQAGSPAAIAWLSGTCFIHPPNALDCESLFTFSRSPFPAHELKGTDTFILLCILSLLVSKFGRERRDRQEGPIWPADSAKLTVFSWENEPLVRYLCKLYSSFYVPSSSVFHFSLRLWCFVSWSDGQTNRWMIEMNEWMDRWERGERGRIQRHTKVPS